MTPFTAHKSRFRKLLQTSSLCTVRFIFSIDPSTDPSIELCVVIFNVAPHKMSASSLAIFPTVETCTSPPPLPPPFKIHCSPCAPTSVRTCIFLFFSRRRTRPRTGPSPCADLTECQNDAVHRPQVALPQTPSNVVTVHGPFHLLHRSIDRSIDRTLRRNFQRRSTQNVGELTGHLSNGGNMHFRSTASTALQNSLLTLRPRRPFERVFFFFFVVVERDLGPDRHLALT
jgi:hypothetical protein